MEYAGLVTSILVLLAVELASRAGELWLAAAAAAIPTGLPLATRLEDHMPWYTVYRCMPIIQWDKEMLYKGSYWTLHDMYSTSISIYISYSDAIV